MVCFETYFETYETYEVIYFSFYLMITRDEQSLFSWDLKKRKDVFCHHNDTNNLWPQKNGGNYMNQPTTV